MSHPSRQLIIFDIASRFHMTPRSLLPAQTFVLSFLFLLTYFVHRVANVVQIPCPWIRSERENTEGNCNLIPPHFCVIPDCVTTCKPAAPRPSFSIFHSLFSVLFVLSHVCTPRPRSPSPLLALALARPRPCSPSPLLALALARPRPCPFLPSSLALALIVRHHHRLRHHRRLIMSTRQHLTPTHRHLRFSRSPSARSQIFRIAAFLPLPPSLVTWGTSPNSARRHRSALQRRSAWDRYLALSHTNPLSAFHCSKVSIRVHIMCIFHLDINQFDRFSLPEIT